MITDNPLSDFPHRVTSLQIKLNHDIINISSTERPDKPYNLNVEKSRITARSVTVSWLPGLDNFSPVRNFTLAHRLREGGWEVVGEPVDPRLTEYTVTG